MSFRLTEHEYECFRQHSLQSGATSVSEFFRLLAAAVVSQRSCPPLQAGGPDLQTNEDKFTEVVNGLKCRLETLDVCLEHLFGAVERLQTTKLLPVAASDPSKRCSVCESCSSSLSQP